MSRSSQDAVVHSPWQWRGGVFSVWLVASAVCSRHARVTSLDMPVTSSHPTPFQDGWAARHNEFLWFCTAFILKVSPSAFAYFLMFYLFFLFIFPVKVNQNTLRMDKNRLLHEYKYTQMQWKVIPVHWCVAEKIFLYNLYKQLLVCRQICSLGLDVLLRVDRDKKLQRWGRQHSTAP